MPDGSKWPSISVVTPSYNQGQFIEETIRSVLLQGYPNLEYIIIDGGSTDQSVEIIQRYEPWLTYWVSEPDRGQAHAINKGWRRATGDIVAWLNSDDLYRPDAMSRVVSLLELHPRVQWMCGDSVAIDSDGREKERIEARLADLGNWVEYRRLGSDYSFPQPSVFLRRRVLEQVGLLKEDLHYSFDLEYWCRVRIRGFEPLIVKEVLSCFRLHPASKTCSSWSRFLEEHERITAELSSRLPFRTRLRLAWKLARPRAVDAIQRAYDEAQGPLGLCTLSRLWKSHPVLILNRQFLGAVRRAITSHRK